MWLGNNSFICIGLLQDSQSSGATSVDEVSQTLREIAQIVGAKKAGSAEKQLRLINGQLEEYSKKLPEGFFDPLIPESSLKTQQVRTLLS